jgi:hypothetical protein
VFDFLSPTVTLKQVHRQQGSVAAFVDDVRLGKFDDLMKYGWGGPPADAKPYLSGRIPNLLNALVAGEAVVVAFTNDHVDRFNALVSWKLGRKEDELRVGDLVVPRATYPARLSRPSTDWKRLTVSQATAVKV